MLSNVKAARQEKKISALKDKAHRLLNQEDDLERKIQKLTSKLEAVRNARKAIQAKFRALGG